MWVMGVQITPLYSVCASKCSRIFMQMRTYMHQYIYTHVMHTAGYTAAAASALALQAPPTSHIPHSSAPASSLITSASLSDTFGLSACLHACMSVCLSACLSTCLTVCVSEYLIICLSVHIKSKCLLVCLPA